MITSHTPTEKILERNALLLFLLNEKKADPNLFFPLNGNEQFKINCVFGAVQKGDKFILLLLLRFGAQFTHEVVCDGRTVIQPIQEMKQGDEPGHTIIDALFRSPATPDNMADLLEIILKHIKNTNPAHLDAFVNARIYNIPTNYTAFAGLIEAKTIRNKILMCIQVMSEYGANPELPDSRGVTALLLAAERGDVEVVEQLAKTASQAAKDFSLYAAANKNEVNVVRTLIKTGARVSYTGNANENALHLAALKGYVGLVVILIDEGKAPIDSLTNDHKKLTPLMAAAEAGQLLVVKKLVEKGAKLHLATPTGITATDFAIAKKQVETTLYLVHQGGRRSNYSSLALAISYWPSNDVERLMSAEPRLLTTRFANNKTTLHTVVELESLPGVKLLVARKPELVTTADNNGLTPLMEAAALGLTEIAIFLLQAHPEHKDDVDSESCSALDFAVIGGHEKTVTALLDAGCQANIKKDPNTITSVEYALLTNHLTIFHKLIMHESTDLSVYRNRLRKSEISSLVLLCVELPYVKTIHAVLTGLKAKKFTLTKEEYVLIDDILANHPNKTSMLDKTIVLLKSFQQEKTNDTNKKITELPVERYKPIDGKAFLRSLGFTEEKIKAFKEEHAAGDAESLPSSITLWNTTPTLSFADGALQFNPNHIHAFRKPTINCYLYVDRETLKQQRCDEDLISRFCHVEPVFDNMHVKKLDGEFEMCVVLPGAVTNTRVNISHELKLPGRLERVYLFPLKADKQSATLYWAFFFDSSGLHTLRDTKSLGSSTQVIQLHAPTSSKSNIDHTLDKASSLSNRNK